LSPSVPQASSLTPHVSTSGSRANRTQRDPVISRIQATSLRLPIQSGTSESNREPPAPKAGVLPSAPLPDSSQSERQRPIGLSADRCLNLRSPGPRPGAITRLRHVLIACAHRERKWAGRCSNPHLRLFWPPPTMLRMVPASQLPARQPVVISPEGSAASAVLSQSQQKNPMPYDTGFALGISPRRDWRHKRNGCAG
jgi:hypothetical protein